MNNSFEIDNWLIEYSPLNNSQALVGEGWNPLFAADRELVYIKFGPFWRLYVKPERFVKRFYHKIYALPVEHWSAKQQLVLYDGFCTMDVTLDIRFQATLKYALNNIEALANVNEHIKASYHEVIINLLEQELLTLSDGKWIQKGVSDLEKKIAIAIGEMLIIQNIQAQVLCVIKPSFAEFPDVQLAQKNVYLCVLKANFETNQAKREELFRQEQEEERQKQEHKQQLLKQLKLNAEMDRQIQAQEALNKKLLLEEQLKQQQEQFEIEKQLYTKKIQQEEALKEISLASDIQNQEKQQEQIRIAEQKKQIESLKHQSKLKERELEAEIANYERQEARWCEAKEKMHKLQLAHELRQEQLEIEHQRKKQKVITEIQKKQ